MWHWPTGRPSVRSDAGEHGASTRGRRRRRRRGHRPRGRLARAPARAGGRRARRAATFGAGASRAAAGMLAPVAEADLQERDAAGAQPGERAALAGVRAPSWRDVTGDRRRLPRVRHAAASRATATRPSTSSASATLRERLGLRVERLLRLRGAAAASRRWRRRCALALALPDDHAVEPRARGRGAGRGVHARGRAAARRASRSTDVRALPAERVVDRRRRVVGRAGRGPGAPGQGPGRCACATRRARGCATASLRFEGGYLVPRGDGRYYLGATMEERGFDTAVTALRRLRAAARGRRGPARDPGAGDRGGARRPAPRDARQRADRSATDPRDERVVWATGHYRNGILLCPLTADLVADELTGEAADHALRPERFAEEHAA